MARRLLLAATGAIALVTAGLGSASAEAAPTAAPARARITTQRSCAKPVRGFAGCFAVARTDAAAEAANARMKVVATKRGAAPAATPAGYGPADLQSAYTLGGTSAQGRTVAIVDAYDDPTAEQDLAVYRSQFGLPACTSSGTNPCFRKVNQKGARSPLPRKDGGWAQEISLDLDMVSAACPSCRILLVEASTASFANLGAAVNWAATQADVVAISNSYGGSDASDVNYGAYYDHPGKAVTVSSGDSGYGAEYPASSRFVTAVGGTSLTRTSTGWTESAWSGAGSGCSAFNTALPDAVGTGCGKRAVADVSAVADPATGVAVYDSTAYQGRSGWLVFGGTSASAPIIASVYALSGNVGSSTTYANALPYKAQSGLNDVTSGSNGTCPAGTQQWCNAGPGWDGPTGLGTPNGVGAF